MTVLSILDGTYRRSVFKRGWNTVLLCGFMSLSAVSFYLFYLSRGQHSLGNYSSFNDGRSLPLLTELGENALSNRTYLFERPETGETYVLDLNQFPVEDVMTRLFAGSIESIKSATIDHILGTSKQDLEWTTRWLDRSEGDGNYPDKYSCENQMLPFPFMRQLIKDYIPITDTNSFFDDQDYSLDLNEPFIVMPFSNQPTLKKGNKVCVRIVVPYRGIGEDDPFSIMYKPYKLNNELVTYPWWDTTMTSLKELNTGASVPITMQPWPGHYLLRLTAREHNGVSVNLPEWARLRDELAVERKKMHIYQADVVIPHDGDYELSSLLEFVEGRYNFEFGPVTSYKPLDLPIYPKNSRVLHVNNGYYNGDSQDMEERLLEEHLALPLCIGADHPGRWLPWPKHSKHDETSVSGLNRNNKYWAPYDCRYRRFSYELFNRCMSREYSRGMEIFGDSNIRRSLKKFVSHGQWCKNWDSHLEGPLVPADVMPVVNRTLTQFENAEFKYEKRQVMGDDSPLDPPGEEPPEVPGYPGPQEYEFVVPEQTRSCYCEDYYEPGWDMGWFNGSARRLDFFMNNTQSQSKGLGYTKWDKGRSSAPKDRFLVQSYKWDGLTYLNQPGWEEAINATVPQPDVAVFSLGNWDAAFSELEPYLKDVDKLIQQIKSHYDLSKTRIVYRTPQYYCCRIDDSDRNRQVSGPRLDLYDWEVRVRFMNELGAWVWNTMTLGESKNWDEKIESTDCPSNHVPADEVEIENQLLMNGLCNIT
jgi:hypothetical protein